MCTPKKFKFDNPLTGFGSFGMGSEAEIYPIFSDGSGKVAKNLTKTPLSEFKEVLIAPAESQIELIDIYYKNKQSMDQSLLIGVELTDFSGKKVLKVGDCSTSDFNSKFSIKLTKGEKIVGFKNVKKDEEKARRFDVQFVIGHMQ